MYVSAIIDPSALDFNCLYKNDTNLTNFKLFIRGICDNGLILFDNEGVLNSELNYYYSKLPESVKYKVGILLKDISSYRRIKLPISTSKTNLVYDLANKYRADTVLVGCNNYECVETTKIIDYVDSNFETKIRTGEILSSCAHTVQIDEEIDADIVKDAIRRCVQYSAILKIKDKQIGQNIRKNNVNDFENKKTNKEPLFYFYQGIRYIARIWMDDGRLPDRKTLEIYTVFDGRGGYSQKEVLTVIDKYLKNKLALEFPDIKFSVQLHDDPYGKYHARFLESKYAIVKFDRGFDMFYLNQGVLKFKGNEMDIKPLTHRTGYTTFLCSI